MRRAPPTRLPPPFLKGLLLERDRIPDAERASYPYTLPWLRDLDFTFDFAKPLTVLVGENGTGKSTLLEAIGAHIGYNAGSGSRDHAYAGGERGAIAGLHRALRFHWLPKVTRGFFFRAESFFNLASYIDDLEAPEPVKWRYWGDRELHTRSHGELFLALCRYRLGGDLPQMLIFDEPEAALSPQRQLDFLRFIDRWLKQGNKQIVIATHAPILMAHPAADLRYFDGARIRKARLQETGHFQLARDFITDPERAVAAALAEPPEFGSEDEDEDETGG